MVVPIRRSSDASAMMRRSMEDADALGGMTVLVAGDDLGAVQAVRDRLAALGADATALAGDTDAIARAAAADPPAAGPPAGAGDPGGVAARRARRPPRRGPRGGCRRGRAALAPGSVRAGGGAAGDL